MGESCPKLLDLISKEREWVVKDSREGEERRHGCGSDESKKLELRLGLPGDESILQNNPVVVRERKESQLLSLNYFPPSKPSNPPHPPPNPWPCSGYQPKELSSQPCCTRIVDLQHSEMKAFSPVSANTAVANSSQKRAAPAAVVGWPPVGSFRKNLASTSSGKPVSEPQSAVPNKPANEKPAAENLNKGLFVKINMEGVPIGRKVDLYAHDSYEKLSSAVDELFRGLLAAQRDSCAGGNENKQEEQKPITGLLDGSGEYTLVYEDNEGDRVLVGDVPWPMFVSTVKRLRVLKTSDLPTLSRGGSKRDKVTVESSSK